MTIYNFAVTLTTSALNLAAQAFAGTEGVAYPKGWRGAYGTAYLSAAQVACQEKAGNTGLAFLGNANLTTAGAGADFVLGAATTAVAGAMTAIASQSDANIYDLAQLWVHGSAPGDVIFISYQQV